MASPAIESRLGERRSGVPDSRLIAGDCCVSPHHIEVFSKAQLQRAFTILLRVTPTRIWFLVDTESAN
jgi:hypothetical protein